MREGSLRISVLNCTDDGRGLSVSVPTEFLGRMRSLGGIHWTTIQPGAIRGNHAHRVKHELLLVHSRGPVEIGWDSGQGSKVELRSFDQGVFIVIDVPPLHSHAIKNTGTVDVVVAAISDQPYDPLAPDVENRTVIA